MGNLIKTGFLLAVLTCLLVLVGGLVLGAVANLRADES